MSFAIKYIIMTNTKMKNSNWFCRWKKIIFYVWNFIL